MPLRPGVARFLLFLGICAVTAAQPVPKDVIGFAPGEDHKLADYAQIAKYFWALDAASDRIQLVEIGRSELGKPILLAYISDPENLRQLEKYRRISERLALGLASGEQEAARLAAEGKAVVWIDSGLHASEVATAQHAPELSYRIVTGTDPEIERIRRNVILLQAPVINPDGLDWVAHWYMGNLGTSYERAPLPFLYHKYAGHDNNRDWFAMNLAETRHVSRVLYHQWFPQIVYNHHQAPPFPARIFVPPYADPLNPHIPDAVMQGIGLLGMAMSERFAREGKTGVLSYKNYDAWWNGGLRSTPAFHNMHGILTETALHLYAIPRTYSLEDIPRTFADGLSAREPSIFYQRPFLGGRWGLREAMDYMHTADMALLTTAAERASDFLLKSYQLARASIEVGKAGNPYAYVIVPQDQWDRPTSVLFLEKLALGGIQIQRARSSFAAGGKTYPAGSYVLPAGQPFRPYLIDLVEPQKYPAGSKRPYDVAGYTFSMQMGVRVERVNDSFDADLESVEKPDRAGTVSGSGPVMILDHRQNAMFRALAELLKAGAGVKWIGGNRVVVAGAPAELARSLARDYGVDATLVAEEPRAAGWRLRSPRAALYQPWVSNSDQGWTEWLFDHFGVPYTLVHNGDFRKGDFQSRFDTIVVASQSAASILHGHRVGEVSVSDSLSALDRRLPLVQRPEYTGGIGIEGLRNLELFVRGGGTLIALDAATDLPIQYFPLPASNRARSGFSCPGSLLRIAVDPTHPLAYGMPGEAIAFSTGGSAFQVTLASEYNRGGREIRSAAKFAAKDLLASGWVSGERAVLGRDVVLEARHGQGKVVLIGIRAQFRGQPHGTFKFLLNAVYLGSAKWEPEPAGL